MNVVEISAVLAKTEIFGPLDEAIRRSVAGNMSEHVFPKGRVIVGQDEPGDELYVIARGTVRVLRCSSKGERLELVRRRSPDCFGELALLDGGLRSATVETTTKATVLSLKRERFLALLRSEPSTVEPLLRILAGMVRGDDVREADYAFLGLQERLACRLLELTKAAAVDQLTRTHRVTQVELAQMIGASRQRVNLALHSLVASGIVAKSHDGISILDSEGLERVAQS